MLKRLQNSSVGEWDEMIEYVLFSYNTAAHDVTRMTPFYMLYGREARLPLEMVLDTADYGPSVNPGSYVRQLRAKLAEASAIARENIKEAQERQKKYYDAKRKEVVFQDGDKVWLYWPPRIKPGQSSKLVNTWYGPFEVMKKTSSVNYVIKDLASKKQLEQMVHVCRLRKWTERKPADISGWEVPEEEDDDFDWRKEPVLEHLEPQAYSYSEEVEPGTVELDQLPLGELPGLPDPEIGLYPLPFEERNVPKVTVPRKVVSEGQASDQVEIEKILDEKWEGGAHYYLVRWKGYVDKHNSWVTEDNIRALKLIREFEKIKEEEKRSFEKRSTRKFDALQGLVNMLKDMKNVFHDREEDALPKVKRDLRRIMGVDSYMLSDYTLKMELEAEIRGIDTMDEALKFIGLCIDNAPMVFRREVEGGVRISTAQTQ
jgi:hypothetical protein